MSRPRGEYPISAKTRHNDRRCVATGQALAPDALALRFVRDPAGVLTADPTEKLPGRGAWITADRQALLSALSRRQFARSFREETQLPEGMKAAEMADAVATLLMDRALASLGLARRAGALLLGFEQVKAAVPRLLAYIAPADAAPDGTGRIVRALEAAGSAPYICVSVRAGTLAERLGVPTVVHAGLLPGGPGKKALYEVRRAQAFQKNAGGTVQLD